jgi:hypothetical protein
MALAHEDEELEEIVTIGRWDRPNGLTVSASQGFVGQEDLRLRPRLRPGDLLEAVPGLIVTQHSGSGKSNQMFLRGFNLDHGTDFASWIDGMPINITSHGHGQGYTDLNFIIPELVESLEFRKGPYYADVGDFSSAGAAFFSTPRVLDTGFLRAGAGKDGYGTLLYANSFDTEHGDLLLGLQSGQYDGPWQGVDEDLAKYNGVVKLTRSVPDRHEWSITFMGYDAEWNSADQVPLRAVEAGLLPRLGTVDETVGGNTSRYSVSGRWHRDIGEQQLTARAYAIDYDLDLFSNFTYFLENPDDGDQIEQTDRRQVYGGDVVWRRGAGTDTTQKLGIAFRYDDVSSVGLFNAVERARTGVVREDTIRQYSAGMHFDIAHRWGDRWRGNLGLRADYHFFDVRESNIVENAGSANEWILSPKLNLVYTLSDTTEAYFSAGTAYHSNDARGIVINVDPVSGAAAQRVDPLVRSKGAEIGLRFFSEERLNVSTSIWVMDLESELLFVGDAGNTEPSRASRRYGIEVPAYYRLNDTLILDAEIALTRSRFRGSDDDAGDEVPGSVSIVAAGGVTFRAANGAFGTLRARHFGGRPLTEDGAVESEPSTVLNLSLGYSFDRFDVRVDVLNLLDSSDDDIAYFYESRLPGEPAGGIPDLHFHPIEPRTYRVYLTWFTGSE